MTARTIATTILCVTTAAVACGFAQTTPQTAGGSASAGAADAGVPPEIKQLRDNLIDAFNKREVDRMLSYLHPDVVVTWQNAEVSHGREGVRKYYERMMVGPDSVVVDMRSNPVVEGRKMYGDTSVSYGAMNDWFKLRDGTEVNLNSRFSAHLARQGDGNWLVTGFHASSDAFEGEVHNLYAKKAGTMAGVAGGVGGLIVGAIVGWLLGRRRPARTVARETA
jgi:ketosteroid isomerase-like protein